MRNPRRTSSLAETACSPRIFEFTVHGVDLAVAIKGESLNDLRRFLAFAHSGDVRYHHHDDQTAQALCLTLVTNGRILSTTGYIQDAIDAERADGRQVSEEAIAHTSPGHFEAINPYGTHTIDVAGVLNRTGRRPLKSTTSCVTAAVKGLFPTRGAGRAWRARGSDHGRLGLSVHGAVGDGVGAPSVS